MAMVQNRMGDQSQINLTLILAMVLMNLRPQETSPVNIQNKMLPDRPVKK